MNTQELEEQLRMIRDSLSQQYESPLVKRAILNLAEVDNLPSKAEEILNQAIGKYKLV